MVALLRCTLVSALYLGICAQSLNLTIGFLPAMTYPEWEDNEDDRYNNEGKKYAGAINVALDQLKADKLYSNISFSYIFKDNQFNLEVSLKEMVDMYHQGVDVILGPENNCVPTAKLASALNLPMLGFRCLDSPLSNKKEFPTFARTVPSTAKASKSILALFKYYGWTSFSVVMEGTSEWAEVSRTLELAAGANNIMVNTNNTYKSNFKYFKEDHQMEIRKIVQDTSNMTRIYIFLGEHDPMVYFMRCLHNYTNIQQHAVIHVRSFDDQFKYNSSDAIGQLISCGFYNESEISDPTPFAQLITILLSSNGTDEKYIKFEDEVRRYLQGPPFNVPTIPGDEKLPVSIYAFKLYDAVMLYARAAKNIWDKGKDPRDGRELMKEIFDSNFTSMEDFQVKIDKNGDAEGAYSAIAAVKSMYTNGTAVWQVKMVGTYDGTGSDHLVYQKLLDMSWLDGVPLSEPKCGFQGEKCQTDTTTIALVSVISCSTALVLIILGVCLWRQYKQKRKIESLLWKLDKQEIEIITGREVDATISEKLDSEKTEKTQWNFLEDGECEQEKSQLQYYATVGYYKNMLVAVKGFRNNIEINKTVKKQLHFLKQMNHENLNKFVGACIDSPNIYIVTMYCAKGCLEDVLQAHRDLFLEDSMIRLSLINDLVKGMLFIHESAIGFHGNLRATKCLVDSRFVLQISGFGLQDFMKNNYNANERDSEKYYRDMLWRAPELLRDVSNAGTQKGDVYSFGIILHEILGLMGPWGDTHLLDKEIVAKVKQGNLPYLRPNMRILKCEDYLTKCMEECWNEVPEQRPDFKVIKLKKLKQLSESLGSNILENMLQRTESYLKTLETRVEERTRQLNLEKKRTEKLLLRMLPKSVAEDLKKGKPVQASYYESVTIYFSDIVGFTKLCSESDPYQIVRFLNDLYTLFDGIIDGYDVYKVETIGDAYMVVSGLPKKNGDNHAGEIASMSLHLLHSLKTFKIHHRPNEPLLLRIGIHSGPVAVGVVGIKMPRYCLFGDTVNTTSRMESTGLPCKVHCSEQAKQLLEKLGGYYLEKRGLVEMKGKGEVLTYWLAGEDSFKRLTRLANMNDGNNNVESACTSARSSIADSLHLMPNGFRRPRVPSQPFTMDEFKLKYISASLARRGSLPTADYRRLSLGIDGENRRGSSPGLKKKFEIKRGWTLKEEDERKISPESIKRSPQAERHEPDGSDGLMEEGDVIPSERSQTSLSAVSHDIPLPKIMGRPSIISESPEDFSILLSTTM